MIPIGCTRDSDGDSAWAGSWVSWYYLSVYVWYRLLEVVLLLLADLGRIRRGSWLHLEVSLTYWQEDLLARTCHIYIYVSCMHGSLLEAIFVFPTLPSVASRGVALADSEVVRLGQESRSAQPSLCWYRVTCTQFRNAFLSC